MVAEDVKVVVEPMVKESKSSVIVSPGCRFAENVKLTSNDVTPLGSSDPYVSDVLYNTPTACVERMGSNTVFWYRVSVLI